MVEAFMVSSPQVLRCACSARQRRPTVRQRTGVVTAHLHLPVRASEKLEFAVRPPAHVVTCAERPPTGARRKRVVDETLRGQRGVIDVAPRHAASSHEQFPSDTIGHSLQSIVDNVQPSSRNRPADGGDAAGLLRIAAMPAGVDGCLGATVQVDEVDARVAKQTRLQECIDRVAATKHTPQRPTIVKGPLIQPGSQQRRHALHRRHALFAQCGLARLREALR